MAYNHLDLHPEAVSFIQTWHGTDGGPEADSNPGRPHLSLQQMRDMGSPGFIDVPYNFTGTRFELFIPTPNSSYSVPTYVYKPSTLSGSTDPPIFVFFHGGAMMLGNRDACDTVCKILSDKCQCLVVNVEYRLYPEAELLEPFDDGVWVTEWLQKNAQLIGGGPHSRVGVGGESAGGRMAASVAHDVPGLAFQVLAYASLRPGNINFDSYEEFRNGPIITGNAEKWIEEASEGKAHHPHPRVSALNRPSFTNLPPALFIVAEIDPLRDENYAYAKKLQESNVTVDVVTFKGVTHAFYVNPAYYPENCERAFNLTADFIKKHGFVGEPL